MMAITILWSCLALLALLPAALLLLQVLCAWLGVKPAELVCEVTPRIAVLIPAHDEAAGITATLQAIVPQLGQRDRILVVADNCSDLTADVARAAGAEVIVRINADARGKGYALQFGIEHLSLDAPDVVIVVDADCLVSEQFVPRLGAACFATATPRQAVNLMHAPSNAGLKMRIAEFAWLLKNQIRPLGYHVLGLTCHLTGTGMAFPWEVIRDAPLASSNITEDMQLGLDLAAAGFAPRFFPHATISSQFPSNEAGIASQRVRWEHGHLVTILHVLPSTISAAIKKRDPNLLYMAIDLAAPPLALFAMALTVLVASAALLAVLDGSILPLLISALAALLFSIAIFTTWSKWGRPIISLSELLSAPLYAMSKLPIYLMFWTKRQTAWVRTDRRK